MTKKETNYGILFSVMGRMHGNGEKLFNDEKSYNKYANQWKTKLESLDTNFVFEEVKNEREIFLKKMDLKLNYITVNFIFLKKS